MINPMVYSNPHNVTGMYSAGKLTTNSSPNYSQYPNLLPSTNMYIAGAKKIKRRQSFRSRRNKSNKSKSRKKIHKMKKNKKYFAGGNTPIAFGYGMDGSSLSSRESMLANPIPYKPYFACNKV
jgi:hypothetical protein